ncbi:MAG: DMT family transporter [Candidatus Zipacnadales bacterium]
MRDNLLAGLLLLVTLIWGWTFPVVKDAVAEYEVLPFLALRFGIAAGVMLPLAIARGNRQLWVTGAGIGLLLAAAYLLQTVGVVYTTATHSGLITGFFVVFAPLCNRLLFGVRIDHVFVGAIAMSLAGLVLLTGVQGTPPTLGDLLTLGCALCFGLQIALLDRYAGRHDPVPLTATQLLAAAAIFGLLSYLFTPPRVPSAPVAQAVVLTGLLATSGGFTVQTAAQRHLPAVRVALILSLEPVFATLFGRWMAGDQLAPLQWLGAGLMVAAFAVANIHQVRLTVGSTNLQPPNATQRSR